MTLVSRNKVISPCRAQNSRNAHRIYIFRFVLRKRRQWKHGNLLFELRLCALKLVRTDLLGSRRIPLSACIIIVLQPDLVSILLIVGKPVAVAVQPPAVLRKLVIGENIMCGARGCPVKKVSVICPVIAVSSPALQNIQRLSVREGIYRLYDAAAVAHAVFLLILSGSGDFSDQKLRHPVIVEILEKITAAIRRFRGHIRPVQCGQ